MWETVTLGDSLTVQNGYAFNSKLFDINGDMGLIRIRDLKKGVSTETRYTGDYDEKYVVKRGDLLIGMDGEFRCYEWKGENALLNQRVCRLQDFDDNLDKSFVLYAINDKLKKIEDITGFTTVKHLSSKTIKDISLQIPPLAEQQRIVAKLDAAFAEIDGAIEVAEKMLSNAEAMRTKFVCQTFQTLDAVSSRLEDVTEILNGFAFKSGDFTTYAGTNVVKITNVGIREFIETDDTQLPTEFAENYSKVSVKEGDVVFALTRTIINGGLKVAKIPEAYHGALLNQRVAAVTASRDSIDTDFLYLYLSSDIVKDYVIEHVNTLMQPNLSIADLRNLEIPVVTLKEQRLTAQRIEEVSSKCTEIQDAAKRKIREYISLKAAILAQEINPSEAA